MVRTFAPRCSLSGCRAKTTDPTGRCHHHRINVVTASGTVAMPAPRPAAPAPEREVSTLRVNGREVVIWEEWTVDGKHHRTDGPARVGFHDDGSVRIEEWFLRGRPHRSGGPARREFREDGALAKEEYFQDGKHHRSDGPAIVAHFPDGSIAETYYRKGVQHREGGPSYVNNGFGGYIEEWRHDGESHRIGAPASTIVRTDGSREESWKMLDDLHRIDGPAEIEFDADGAVVSEEWWFGGQKRNQATIGAALHGYHWKGLDDVLREEIRASSLAPLLAEGVRPEEISAVLEQRVYTLEGVREVLGGAPAEWVRAFEEARRPEPFPIPGLRP